MTIVMVCIATDEKGREMWRDVLYEYKRKGWDGDKLFKEMIKTFKENHREGRII